MRELLADLFITVDGYAAGRESPAFFGYSGPELFGWIEEQLAKPHTMVMGAHTYRTLAGIVAFAGDADASSARMTELPKLVFSSSLRPPLDWANSTVIAEAVADAVPNLKQQDGDPLRVIGSVGLVRSLLRLGLVDRLRLMLFPQILGATGRERIFDELPDLNLGLISTRVLDGRLVLLEYAPQEPTRD